MPIGFRFESSKRSNIVLELGLGWRHLTWLSFRLSQIFTSSILISTCIRSSQFFTSLILATQTWLIGFKLKSSKRFDESFLGVLNLGHLQGRTSH